MTDKKFEALMNQCLYANLEYKALLVKIEDEYERRFGHNPSDIDDDQWIDLFRYEKILAGYDYRGSSQNPLEKVFAVVASAFSS